MKFSFLHLSFPLMTSYNTVLLRKRRANVITDKLAMRFTHCN